MAVLPRTEKGVVTTPEAMMGDEKKGMNPDLLPCERGLSIYTSVRLYYRRQWSAELHLRPHAVGFAPGGGGGEGWKKDGRGNIEGLLARQTFLDATETMLPVKFTTTTQCMHV